MPKLTDRAAISTNINEDLLIHVVDTTTTDTSYKATLSQLYAIFPKNTGTGATDYVARWTAANELGIGVLQDNGSNVAIGAAASAASEKRLYIDGASTGQKSEYGLYMDVGAPSGQNATGSFALVVAGTSTGNATGYQTQVTSSNVGGNVKAFYSENIIVTGDKDYVAGFRADGCSVASGTTTASYGVFSGAHNEIAAGTITDAYHIYLQSHGTVTDAWGIYQAGTSDKNLFRGNTIFADSGIPSTTSKVRADISGSASLASDSLAIDASNYNDASTSVDQWARGVRGRAQGGRFASAGTFIGVQGVYGEPLENSTVSEGIGVMSQVNTNGNLGSNLYNVYGFFLEQIKVNTGDTVNSVYGLYLQGSAGSGTVNNKRYGIYQQGANDLNVFKGNVQVEGSQIWSDAQTTVYEPSGSGGAAVFTIDWDLGNVAIVNLGSASGTVPIAFTNYNAGANYFIKIIQHATTPVNLSWSTEVKFPSGTAPTISTGANAIDAVALTCTSTPTVGAAEFLANFSQDYQ